MLLIISLAILTSCAAQMSLIGTAIEGYGVCDVLSMVREVGGRPSEENHWNGTFDLSKWPTLGEVRISLTLDNPAIVQVDEEEARILVNGNTFHLSYFDAPPKLRNPSFFVKGPARGAFPNVEKITLNGEVICDKPPKWEPSILGITNRGESAGDAAKNKLQCGLRLVQHQELITNGFPTQEGDWPWHAAIRHISRSGSVYACGGTLVNKNTVLTAGHCVHNNERVMVPERLLVQLGKHNREIASTFTQEYSIYRIIPHPNYDSAVLANDIALLRLQNDVRYSDYVQPICLWHKEENLNEVVGRNGTVIGWGLDADRKLTDILSQGTMPIVSISACLSSARQFYGIFLTESNFCAGFRNGTSVCKGDSGGGLFLKEQDNRYYIRGVVSLAKAKESTSDCDPKSFVIFTDVAKFIDWIKESFAN